MELLLGNKVALVTGTSKKRGNGRAIALTLAGEGCHVACVDWDIEGAKAIAEEIKGLGRKSIAVKVDQSDQQQVRDAVQTIVKELGPVDILVNNAAVGSLGMITKPQLLDWEKALAIDLSGPFYWMRETMASMIDRKWGRIINISSMAGVMGGFGQCSYSAGKGGLISLTKTAALEGARDNVTANAVSLGSIATDMFDQIRPDMRERIVNCCAMRRAGDPQDVGDIVAFLASDRAKYITGANVIVDGGMSLFVY
jgi:3-oxoacyl-[acyl-carrier protein] reductase